MNHRPTLSVRPPAGRAGLIALVALTALAAGPASAPDDSPALVLQRLLADTTTADAALAALTATGDKELLPIFAAVAASSKSDPARRMLAVAAAAKLAGPDAADILLDRLRRDDATEVRTEALVQLIAAKAISPEQLTELLASPDTTLQCLAARALVRAGQPYSALTTLRNLTGATDPAAASLARITLLATGEADQLAPLTQAMSDRTVPPRLLAMVLAQIGEDKITSAVDLAKQIAASTDSLPMKVRAYRAAAAAAGANGPALLADAIAASPQTVLRVQLLHALADLPDSRILVEDLSHGDDAVAALARLEVARLAAAPGAVEQAACQAVALSHAVVIDYCLDRARQDIAARPEQANAYTPALIAILRSVSVDSSVMLEEHTQAAQAAELLGELGNDQAAQTLTAILSGDYNALTRAVAAGMLRCKNKAVCQWMAPLLASPYEELSTDAALTLAQHGAPQAAGALQTILRQSRHNPPELTALAAWYLAKLSGQAAPTVTTATEAAK